MTFDAKRNFMRRIPRIVRLCSQLAATLLLAALAGTAHAEWTIETIAGNGKPGAFPGDEAFALDVAVDLPFGVQMGPDGKLYITSVGQHRVLRLDPANGKIASVAGSGVKGYAGDGGVATRALLNEPYEIRFDSDGNMYFVEMQNHLIRRVDVASGMISTVAGNPRDGFGGDHGDARHAQFRQPHSIAFDDRDNLYVADIGNHRIRRIDTKTGRITSIAGNGALELPTDGSKARGRPILGPRALSVAGRTLWIALREGNSVWRMDLDDGTIHHVAGTGEPGYSGDGGLAKSATFNGPKGIAATTDGIVYVADSENQAIRRIDTASGQIMTIAGGGPKSRGFAIEKGSALSAKVDRPHGIGLAPGGGVYIGDTNNHRVRWIKP